MKKSELNRTKIGYVYEVVHDGGISYYERVGTNSKGHATFKRYDIKKGKTIGRETALYEPALISVKRWKGIG